MPKKKKEETDSQSTNFKQVTGKRMEYDNINEESKTTQNKEEIPDLTGIEKEEIIDSSGFIYNQEKFNKCFIPENDLAKTISLITLKVLLSKKKYANRNIKTFGPKEVYIISRIWFEKWKSYTRYETMKRIIRSYQTYEIRPIKYKPNEKDFPGEIKNSDLLIRNKNNEKDRNILVSKSNNCLDTRLNYIRENNKKKEKKDFVLLPKERFDLLNNYFKCDNELKANIKYFNNNDEKNYDVFCVHLRLIFLPTLDKFKKVNEENIESFKKEQKIIYDVYFKQSDTKKEIIKELLNIFKENPHIINNMGIEINAENIEIELSNHIENLKFYIPNDKNIKSIQEMVDYIFSDETIEKIKKDEKIEEKDIDIQKIEGRFDLNNLFHLNWKNQRNNIDEVQNGIIFLEYLISKEEEEQKKNSIFKIKEKIKDYYETSAYRGNNGSYNSIDSYNLDNFSLDKNKNKHGLVGLNNLGNTCYMNTGLQCLSNCELLTKFFLNDYYKKFVNKENPIGSKGEIVEKYSQLIHHIWYGNNDCVLPIQFKIAFGKMYNTFDNFRQQDTQEFISYLLDALHEDLNKVLKKPYIETKNLSSNLTEEEQFKIQKDLYLCRNQSFIADLIYGFYKSTIYCPNEKCQFITKSFEPFNMITLSLVNEAQIRKLEEFHKEQNKKLGIKTLYITFVPFKINFKPLKFSVKIKKDMDIFTFKKKIEIITGFNKNSFEIYKMRSSEFMHFKPDMYLLEDFLKGENKLFLFQIPPYVFDKPLDYFDKAYEDLNNDQDKFFLEEEKYEGNDIYSDYNQKEPKSKTDDNIENGANKMEIEEEKEEKKINKCKDDEDIEMKDDSLILDRNKWIKAELYNFSYSNEKNNETKKEKSNKKNRDKNREKNKDKNNEKNNDKKNNEKIREDFSIGYPRIIYINKEWDNTQVYTCILEMLEGVRSDLPEIKEEWFKDLKEVTKKISKMEDNAEKNKKNFILDYFDEINTHPLMLQYLGIFNFVKTNIMEKKENWKNLIFPFDSTKHTIKKIINSALGKNNELTEIELLFKIIWKPTFSNEYKEGTIPIELVKSEKLENIFNAQKEDEYLKKNNLENIKESGGKKKNKKLKLEDLLNNFNEIEKLTKDNQWYCPKCKNFQLADKKMEIYSANEVLIIHLKRFRNNRKIENLVEFPIEELNLGNYMSNKKEKYIYDLFAVANHSGNLHGGHYYAYCKNNIDGEWYEFNDSHVSKIDKKKVVNDNAYVLFYNRRREQKINEEELFMKPFIEIDYSKYTSN